ncbi:DUF4126 family protein [candidate division KSB3 bacterium]|uniref:DUF4126 family protein n=2 Tax=candidate division KSB3 bacterium TaxID=2044937 RepID=A0A9D5JW11_9BACT|nr:DUF4126 family protein [candidate division KSB3 bacterium]MBD3325180.1 DUF4126 family protein [candidate division KSB3 bacterium]
MDELSHVIQTISMTMGAAWASGINLYATILMLGILGMTGNLALPPGLEILANPAVIIAAGIMYAVEFFADKIPAVDTAWDSIHTFIRIPAGALLAANAIGDVSPPMMLAAAIIGGGIAAESHAAKAGSRVLINTSPEPFTNWAASIGEDVAVVAGLWAALNHPWVFIIFLVIFTLFVIWLLPKIWRGIKKVFGAIARLLGGGKSEVSNNQGAGSP